MLTVKMETEQPEVEARPRTPENTVSVQGPVTLLTGKMPKFNDQRVCENEFLPDQQLCNQENNSSLEQEELLQIKVEQEGPELHQIKEEPEEPEPQIKVEHEESWNNQEVEQFIQKRETNILMVTSISVKNEHREPNREQLPCLTAALIGNRGEEESQHADLRSAEIEELKMKKRHLKRSYRDGSCTALPKRLRKEKFTPEELKVLVEECCVHSNILQNQNFPPFQKKEIWIKILIKVNIVGGKNRSVEEIRKRWNDLRRRTKEKIAFNRASAKETGGGPVEEMSLTTLEEAVQQSFTEEQASGLDGVDPLEVSQESFSALTEEMAVMAATQPLPPVPPGLLQDASTEMDLKSLEEKTTQTTIPTQELPQLASELGALCTTLQDIRGDTQALVTHTHELVGVASVLAVSVQALVHAQQRTNDSLVRILERLTQDGPTASSGEQPRLGRRHARRGSTESEGSGKHKR
ncbi:uncharacterized protein KZ484_026737 [Pholidichthys leucotaenia]